MQRKVLIVEDNVVSRKLLRRILNSKYDVIEAESGEEAIEELLKNASKISAVILDIMLPGMSGHDVLKHMRSHPDMDQIPVIVASGADESEEEVRALSEGANDYIVKPYNPEIIWHRVQNTIHLREQAAIVNAISIDALTGLYSRSAFFSRAAQMISGHPSGYYCMACFDVEHFKVINDQYGNAKGDEVLKAIADIFRKGFSKAGGICCRVMADNFAVLYPKKFMTSGELEEIRRKARVLDGSISQITFSIGRYIVEDTGLEPSAMYDRAVMAKETVKGKYDCHIALFNETMRQNLLVEQQIISDMKQSLHEKQFEVWFQPQFNHTDGSIVGAEALVRWRHPKKGIVSPSVFVPLFEKNGFIYELDKYVWEQACIFQKHMAASCKKVVPVSVNISRYDVFQPDIVDYLCGLVCRYRIPVNLICLEITESAFAQSAEQIIAVVEALKHHGFTVEIDDFGSGYSSLNTLKDVPADVVKLDMKFLEGKTNFEKGGNILESIVRMAQWIDMSVIAEGVETIEQADFLKSIGCSYIQGYLYSKPIPMLEYEELLLESPITTRRIQIDRVENYNNEEFWNPSSLDTLIFNSFVGGASIFEYKDEHITVIRVNDKYAKVIGGEYIDSESAMKIQWAERLSSVDYQNVMAVVRSAIATREEVTSEVELHNLRANGRSAFIRSTIRMIARTGKRYLFYAMHEDVTRQKETSVQVENLVMQLQTVMDNVGSGITATTVKDGHVEYIFANEYYYHMMGFTKEQYHKEVTNEFELICPNSRQEMYDLMDQVNTTDNTFMREYQVVRRDGEKRWVRIVLRRMMMRNYDQAIQLGVFRDITEEKMVQNQLCESSRQLKELNDTLTDLLNSTPGGFLRVRLDESNVPTVTYINRGFCELLQVEEDELRTYLNEDPFWGVHPDDVSKARAALRSMYYSREPANVRYRIKGHNEDYITLMMLGKISEAPSGEVLINAFFSDITSETKEDEKRKELMENLPYGAGIYEYTGGTVNGLYLNSRFLEYAGYQRGGDYSPDQSSMEHGIMKYVQPEDCELLMSNLRECIEQNKRLIVDIHILCKDGEYLPFHIDGSIVTKTYNRTLMYVSLLPINEEEVAVRNLVPVILDTMMASTNDIAYVKDKNLVYVCASESYTQLLGLKSAKEIIGKTDLDVFPRKYAEKFRSEDRKVMEHRESLVDIVELMPPAHSNMMRYTCTSKYLLKDRIGNIIGIYGVGHDITSNRESFERLRLLTDSIPGGLATYEVTPDGLRRTYFSDGICAISGFTREEYEELSKKDALTRVKREDRKVLQTQIENLIDKDVALDCTFRVLQKGGGYRWTNMKGVAKREMDGVVYINAVFLDVNEKKLSEIKLAEMERENWRRYTQEQQLRKALIRNSIYYYRVNLTTEMIEEYHTKYKDTKGVRKGVKIKDVMYAELMKNVEPEYRKQVGETTFLDSLRKAYSEGNHDSSMVYRRNIPGRGYCYVRAYVSIMKKPDSEEVLAFIHCQDIDFMMRKQMAFERAMGSNLDSVILLNSESGQAHIVHMKDNIGKVDPDVSFDFDTRYRDILTLIIKEEDRNAFESFFRVKKLLHMLKEEKSPFITYRVIIDDKVRYMMTHVFYLDDHKQDIVLTRNDVTNIYEEEQRKKSVLEAAIEDANRANQAKSEFLSCMSHDIRTPLNAVLAFSNETMLEGANEEQLRKYLSKINMSGVYLLGIVNDVLDMSRIEQNKVVLKQEPYAIDDFRSSITNIMSGLCKSKGIAFTMNTKKVKSAVMYVDHIRFEQIFINLLSNAVKFTRPGGKVTFAVEDHELKDVNRVMKRFIVADNGIGMSKEFVPHAFDSFMQEYREEVDMKNQGTGLGLSIVKELVNMMDGTISIESTYEKGTTIFVDIPMEMSVALCDVKDSNTADYENLRGMHVLLMEDNEINAEIAVSLLERYDVVVECAENGKIGCEMFEAADEGYYRMILMDIRMPVMDGLTAATKIRSMKRNDANRIPIIAMTADAFSEDEESAHKAGMNAHISKPVEPGVLYDCCAKFAKNK